MKSNYPCIVVVGSFNIDLMSRAPKIPVAGETVLGGPFKLGPGGKGSNQAIAAIRLGAKVQVIMRLGTDIFGDQALEYLKKEGIGTNYLVKDSKNHTGVALIVVDEKGENMIVVAPGANGALSSEDVNNAKKAIYNSDVLLTQFEIPMQTVKAAIKIARDSGVKTILNPAPGKKINDGLLSQVSILTPNETEASLLTGIKINNKTSAKKAAYKLIGKGVNAVIFTLGQEGALVVTSNEIKHIPGKRTKAIDTTGAGDAFNGGLAFAIAEGRDIIEAVKFANCVAALSVTKIGAASAMPTREEVEKFRIT